MSVIVVALFEETEERVLFSGKRQKFNISTKEKYTLDTLPLLDEGSHDHISYNQFIHSILEYSTSMDNRYAFVE